MRPEDSRTLMVVLLAITCTTVPFVVVLVAAYGRALLTIHVLKRQVAGQRTTMGVMNRQLDRLSGTKEEARRTPTSPVIAARLEAGTPP